MFKSKIDIDIERFSNLSSNRDILKPILIFLLNFEINSRIIAKNYEYAFRLGILNHILIFFYFADFESLILVAESSSRNSEPHIGRNHDDRINSGAKSKKEKKGKKSSTTSGASFGQNSREWDKDLEVIT